MDVAKVLRDGEETILEEACSTLGRSHVTHYEAAGDSFTRHGPPEPSSQGTSPT